ncbi:DUF3618 domain-containing protein [Arcanobacterium hippocoleae]|uniref:DUF3618 domain-containing protein n=1 Tax=Arcanobacterium hippocoleae TaxID=149017 RepID=UPI00333E62D6
MNEQLKAKEAAEIAKARLAAQMKRPADYDLASEDDRSISEVEADLARLRLELTATVDELAGRLSPKALGANLKTGAKNSATHLGVKTKEFGNNVINGDPAALKKLGLLWRQ